MDMQTLRAGDTGFDSPFHLVCTKDTEVRAFMSYFDVAFEHKCQTPVYMTTGAASAPTHWKQTVLYLETPLTGGWSHGTRVRTFSTTLFFF
jgi:protein arginine N-methyltransferase 1